MKDCEKGNNSINIIGAFGAVAGTVLGLAWFISRPILKTFIKGGLLVCGYGPEAEKPLDPGASKACDDQTTTPELPTQHGVGVVPMNSEISQGALAV